jgi:hypothetical protein
VRDDLDMGLERAPKTAALAGQAGHQPGDDRQPQSPDQPRGVFEVDEDAALAELEKAWTDGGYHGFCVPEHSLWSAISSSGEVLTGNTPDGLDQQIRAHWQALQ